MIVVDTNVIAYLYLPTEFTQHAENLLKHDSDWAVPLLWRSEFRNVLALYIRKGLLTFDEAYRIQSEAEELLAQQEYEIPSYEILALVSMSGCSAYDCEFVALAKRLGVKLVTSDAQLLKRFPDIAVALAPPE